MAQTLFEMIQLHVYRFNREQQCEHLIMQRAPDEIIFPGLWQMVTGYIEDGETAVEAALRELKEETNLTPHHFWVVPYTASFYNYRKDAIELIPVFATEVAVSDKVILSHEHSSYQWVSSKMAQDHFVFPGHHAALRIIQEYLIDGKNADLFTRIF